MIISKGICKVLGSGRNGSVSRLSGVSVKRRVRGGEEMLTCFCFLLPSADKGLSLESQLFLLPVQVVRLFLRVQHQHLFHDECGNRSGYAV